MTEQISRRISKELGIPDLTAVLADKLSGADLHSLLLNVVKQRIARIEARELAAPSPVTKPCSLDGRLLNRIEALAFAVARDYEAVELSPVNPLGAISVLTGLDQGNVLSTVRPFECAADPTVAMALECARRRKNPAQRKSTMRLCTSQRILRFPAPTNPAYTSHFKILCLTTAGRDVGSFAFQSEGLREHVGFYLDFLEKLAQTSEFAFSSIDVQISDSRVVSHLCSFFGVNRDEVRALVRARDSNSSEQIIAPHRRRWPQTITDPATELADFDVPAHLLVQMNTLKDAVIAPLSAAHKGVSFSFNMQRLTGLGYYEGSCFHIKLKNTAGETFMLADGGMVNWTQRLLSDSKERLMTSAIGIELLCRLFRTD